MDADVRNRIKEVLNQTGTSVNSLAMEFGENQSKLSKQISLSTTISVNTILLILQKFPKLSAEWLLRGNGPMYIPDKPAQDQQSASPAKLTLELEVGDNNVIKMRLKDKVIQLAE